jgi:hypothetical protein
MSYNKQRFGAILLAILLFVLTQFACHAFKYGDKVPILDQSGAVAKQDLIHIHNL